MMYRYIGSIIGETDIYNHNRYEYYCVTCEPVPLCRFYHQIGRCSSSRSNIHFQINLTSSQIRNGISEFCTPLDYLTSSTSVAQCVVGTGSR